MNRKNYVHSIRLYRCGDTYSLQWREKVEEEEGSQACWRRGSVFRRRHQANKRHSCKRTFLSGISCVGGNAFKTQQQVKSDCIRQKPCNGVGWRLSSWIKTFGRSLLISLSGWTIRWIPNRQPRPSFRNYRPLGIIRNDGLALGLVVNFCAEGMLNRGYPNCSNLCWFINGQVRGVVRTEMVENW